MNLPKKQQPNQQAVAIEHCRSIPDDEWRRFKRAVDGFRKSDQILSGEDIDSDIGDISDRLLETK